MGGGASYEDLINQMFGNRGGDPHANGQRRKVAPDKIVKVSVSPIESYIGAQKTIQYIKNNQCDACGGGGGEQQVCTGCNGMGFQVKSFGTGFMTQQFRTTCTGCGGRGYTLIHRCYSCNGNGVKPTTNQISIKLPVGVDSGQFLKFADLGDFRNGEYGDLILQLEVIPQDGYEKMNNDLIYSLYLNLDEVQKDKFTIPHPDGDLNINAPNVFDTSKPLRLRGKGFPGGDMYVKLNVRFQKTI
jgi:molecular chaperone DnaJ